ncbi:MAG TPA: substrate-binding domain-containing protein, partial [Pirellulales bacterium]
MTLDPKRASLHRRDFHRQLAALGWATASGGLLAGCSTREEIPAGPGASGTGEATGAASTETIMLGLIPKSYSNPIFNAAKKGAEDKAAELTKSLGRTVKVEWRGPNDEDGQKQAELIEQLTAEGVKGIAIACSDASKVTRQLDDAIAKGVAAMCFDSDAPESKRLCYVGTDDTAAGKQVMLETIKLLGDKPPVVAILAGNQTATNLQKRVAGARAAVESTPSAKLVEVVYHKETPQDAYQAVEQLQKTHPEINGWAMVGGWPLMTPRPLPWNP